MKDIFIGREASERAVESLQKIANAVGSTLGPAGCPAIIDKYEPALKITRPSTTKDGVTLLEHLRFEDTIDHAVHGLCESAALHAVQAAGDGTTSTIVLASQIAQAILKDNSKTPQAYARKLRTEINACIEKVDDFILEDDEQLSYFVAKTSANGDEEIAKISADVVEEVSKYSNIQIVKDPSSKERYRVDRQDGYTGGAGYRKFRQLMTTISHRANDVLYEIDLNKVGVVVFNGSLVKFETVEKIMDSIFPNDDYDYILMLAFSIDDKVVNDCMLANRKNKKKVILSEVAFNGGIEGHGYQVFLDTAAYTGATVYDPINEFKPEFLGTCNTVSMTAHKTIFKGRAPNNTIKERCKENDEMLKYVDNQYQRDIISTRNAELAEGLTTVYVGGGQNADVQERADRLDDAIRASQSVHEGVVAGGGLIYARVAEAANVSPELKEALYGITKKVLENYGEEENISNNELFLNHNYSLNLSEGVLLEKALECGVIDSATAVKTVLKQACQLATLVTTTRCLSLDNRQKERNSLKLMESMLNQQQ